MNVNTIIRRLVTVLQFYKWAQTANFGIQNIPENGLLKSTDVDTEIEPRDEEKQHISYLDEVQRVEILRALGPYPDAWAASHYELASERLDEPQSAPKSIGFINTTSKDSLAALISISTGLRITEVCNLRLEHFSHVPQNVDALEKHPISVRGKRRKKRDVDFSGWLITQIRTYVQCERAHVMATTGKADHGFVLVNPLRSRRFAGNKVNPRSIQRAFFDACVSAGYFKVESKYIYKNIEGSICTEQVESIAPLFVFHDLRHTFAITTYFIRKYNSTMPDPDPIEYIRKMLGHESRDTTTDIYLARIDEIERKVGDKFIEYMNGKTSRFPL